MKTDKWKFPVLRRLDAQVAVLTAIMVVLTGTVVFFVEYTNTYADMIVTLTDRVNSIYNYIEKEMDKTTFYDINTKEDITKKSYIEACELFERIRRVTGVQYLYTAKKNNDGQLIYVIDGLEKTAPDIRYPGDEIEEEIQEHLNRALAGEIIYPSEITPTEWGDIFITYLPVHSKANAGEVIGVIGIEFKADHQSDIYKKMRVVVPLIIIASCIISALYSVYFFRRISNPAFKDLANTDSLTRLKNRNAYELDLKNMRARGQAEGCAMILTDLNGLKSTNDSSGHEAGDLYLKTMSKAMRMAYSGSEIMYRVGGDEFVIIIPQANDELVMGYLNRLAEQFNERKAQLMPYASYAVGYSIVSSNESDAFDKAYAAADKQMYLDKSSYYENMKNNKQTN